MDYIIQKTQRKVKLKKRNSPVAISVKAIHNDKMEYFNKLQTDILPAKIKQLKDLTTKNKPLDRYTIKVLTQEIQDIENRTEENEYLLKTCKILDEYFMLDSGEQKDTSSNSRKTEIVREYYQVNNLDLPKEYRYNIYEDASFCKNCNTNQYIDDKGTTCENCGLTLNVQDISREVSYKEKQDYDAVVVLDYKRVDYFKQWLNQIQAKEQTEIPQDVIDTVTVQLKTERVKSVSKITHALVKRLLKKTNNSKYYEHIPSIISRITGTPALNIPVYIEQKLIAMFEEIQIPWEKYKERTNFFSYPYTLHKFCQILGLDEYLKYFPLLKKRELIYKQDVVWKKIVEFCKTKKNTNVMLEDVEWKYISSF